MNDVDGPDAMPCPEESLDNVGKQDIRRHAEAPVHAAGSSSAKPTGRFVVYLAFLGSISTDLAKVGGSISVRAWDIAPLKSQPKIFLSRFLLILCVPPMRLLIFAYSARHALFRMLWLSAALRSLRVMSSSRNTVSRLQCSPFSTCNMKFHVTGLM